MINGYRLYFKSIFIWVVLFLNLPLHSQIKNFGSPFIINYTPDDYHAGTKNWSSIQDTSGMMYFANHFGLLNFDGANWDITVLPSNQSFVRCMKFDVRGHLFLGCQNEFGYVVKHENGQFEYRSISDSIPEKSNNFGDVWQIFPVAEAIYFFASNALFKYDYETITLIKAQSSFLNAFYLNGKFFLFDKEHGLQELIDDKLVDAPEGDFFKNTYIPFMFKYSEDSYLICTENKGMYLYDFASLQKFVPQASSFLASTIVSTGEVISDKYFALGTINKGLVIMDMKGRLIQHLNTDKGLQNNTIISVFKDYSNNLWVTTGYGIDYVMISSPFSFFGNEANLYGEIYQAKVYDHKLYVAGLQGIEYIDWKQYYEPGSQTLKFKELASPKNVIRKIQEIENQLLVSHHKGLGTLNNVDFKNINTDIGAWTCLQPAEDHHKLIVGTYNGFQLYEKNHKNNWEFVKPVAGFNISSRIVEQDEEGNIWMAHGYKGIYRIQFNAAFDSVSSFKLYDSNSGFPSDIFINLFKIRGEIVFGTEKGVYKYNAEQDRMEPHSFYVKYLGDKEHIRFLKEDLNTHIWYVKGQDGRDVTGILKTTKSGNIVNETTPFQLLSRKHIPGFENISFHENHVFFGTKKGLIDYDLSMNYNFNDTFSALIHAVVLSKSDSMIYGSRLYHPQGKKYRTLASHKNIRIIEASQNDLYFEYAAAFYEFPDKILYASFLEGYDDTWSEWSNKTTKEYTNLPGGAYTFRIKAKNIYDVESHVGVFQFQIKKPWYKTSWFYFIYVITLALLFYVIIRTINNRFKMEKLKLRNEEIQKQEALMEENKKQELQSENKIFRLEQDKLQERLSSFTMSIMKKNELFKGIQQRIEKLIYISKPEVSFQLKNVLKEIEQELEKGDQWKEFEIHFNKTHRDFLGRLQQEYPELTTKDLKFCAYIRMNLSSKEIVSLLNITIRGVEAARFRLRKRFDLNPDVLLDDFILKF